MFQIFDQWNGCGRHQIKRGRNEIDHQSMDPCDTKYWAQEECSFAAVYGCRNDGLQITINDKSLIVGNYMNKLGTDSS